MSFVIHRAESLKEYLASWKKAMRDTPWFGESQLFGNLPNEIMKEIRQEFDKPKNIYLTAKAKEGKETFGVLGVVVKDQVGTLGRWEPAVPLKCRESGVGEALLKEASARLRQKQVSKIRCILKFPFNQPKTASWHMNLYERGGFKLMRPSSILLLADLSKVAAKPSAIKNLHIVNGSGLELEEFAAFTQKAYMSTPQDRAVHKSDPYISKRENVLKVLQAIKVGKMGHSPPECWKVAKFRDNVAGFVIAFMQKKSRYRPACGVVAEVGVFPEFRRKGIAMLLLSKVFECFRKRGCGYSLVGTPKKNLPGLKLYKKMGYVSTFEQIDFEKAL